MTDDKFELTVIIVSIVSIALALSSVLIAALYFGSTPNDTAVLCVERGFQLIEDNCIRSF